MSMTSSMSTRSIPPVPSRMAVPPPRFDLLDGDAPVGWVDGRAVGFRGFGNEVETVHAAWVAYRTMTRRFARDLGRRPPPIDTEPMSLRRNGEVEHILASDRPIARLVRPGADSRSGQESFGFEMQVPVPASELTMRATADLVYRAMRRSGTRWMMWAPAPVGSPAGEREPAGAHATETASRPAASQRAGMRSATAFAALSIVLIVLALVAPDPIGTLLAAAGLVGLLVVRIAASFTSWRPRGAASVRA